MQYNFTSLPDRQGTGSRKWQQMLKEYPEGAGDIIPLSVADMEFQSAPEIIEGLRSYLREAVLGYSVQYPVQLQAVCQWLKRKHHYEIDPAWIVSTPGVVNAFTGAIRAFSEKGDGVILFRPAYPPMGEAIKNSNRKEINIPLINNESSYTIDFEDFAKKAKEPENKILLFCSPHNPTGRVWTREEVEKTAKIALENNLVIISDEIWNDIVYKNHSHTITASISEEVENITITLTAPSKTFNIAGLMCSNIIISNPELRKKFQKTILNMCNDTVNALGYKACEIAYTKAWPWVEEMISVVEKNAQIMGDFCKKWNIPYSKPEGTYIFWADFRGLGMNETELEDFMKNKAHFFTSQGYTFGEEGKGYERINIALPTAALKAQLGSLEKALTLKVKR